jgi:hypothetical protein
MPIKNEKVALWSPSLVFSLCRFYLRTELLPLVEELLVLLELPLLVLELVFDLRVLLEPLPLLEPLLVLLPEP